jgi:error-prone DNA polymerase
MQDLPRHLGQHSGGMVVCQGELSSVVPLENASMPGRVVVQWDKEDCADMGLIKVDLLGLGMMAVLQDTLTLINTGQQASGPAGQQEVTLASLPPDDPAVYEMLRAAETIGVFQVESRAQMATLPRMRPERFYDLVVEVALIRPGPIVGQMVHPYLSRRAGREEVAYDHPLLEPILKRTLGVPLFQEQLLRMAMAVAGFTGGQAEDLRRAMGFKRSEKRMKQLEGLLREGMAKHGITGEVADKIVLSITSFALYGFPESHAASFALLAYASAYFKVHYPAAFFTALLNNQPMGFYHPATLVKDAQRRGVRFNPIDVQVSDWDCTVETDGAVRLGLRYVRGLRADAGKAIAKAEGIRQQAEHNARCPKCGCDDSTMIEAVPQAPTKPHALFCNVCSHEWSEAPRVQTRFRSIDDLVRRVALRRDEIAMLAEIGALNSLGHDRRSAMWQVERAIRPAGELYDATVERLEQFERVEPTSSPLEEMTISERLIADYTGTGLTVGPHPLTFRRRELAMRGVIPALELPRQRSGRRVRTAGMVITRQRPGTAKGFVFLTLEDETGISNIIIRPDLYAADRLVVVESSFLLVEGILQNEDGVTSIKAERMSRLEGMPDEAAIDSHDFH